MFVPELVKKVGGLRLESMLPIIAAVVVLLVATGAYALTMIPPTVQWNGKVLFLPPQPSKPWVTADTLLYKGKSSGEFISLGRNAKLENGDHNHLQSFCKRCWLCLRDLQRVWRTDSHA